MQKIIKHTLLALLPGVVLSHAIFADTKTQTTTQPVSDAERIRIESIVHDYLVKKPEVLIEAMQTLQKKEMEQTQAVIKQTEKNANGYAKELFKATNDPVGGNANGKVTVVEFFDYQCPHCVAMSPVLDKIIKSNADVRVIYKELPIRGPMSEFAARAALAANKQGKYDAFHHQLMSSNQPLSETVIFDIAKKTGLNVEQLKKDMSSDSVTKQLQVNMKLRDDLNLFGTPAIFVGKTDTKTTDKVQYAPGRVSEVELQKMIKQA